MSDGGASNTDQEAGRIGAERNTGKQRGREADDVSLLSGHGATSTDHEALTADSDGVGAGELFVRTSSLTPVESGNVGPAGTAPSKGRSSGSLTDGLHTPLAGAQASYGSHASHGPSGTSGPAPAGSDVRRRQSFWAEMKDSLGAHRMGRQVPNPFKNATKDMSSYEKVKMVFMCLTLIPFIRIILLVVSLTLLLLWLRLVTLCESRDKPHGCIRRWLITFPTRITCRFMLMCFGVFWIDEKYPVGTPQCYLVWSYLWQRNIPRILVSNHVSMLDSFFYLARLIPVPVAKADVANYPFLGGIIMKVLQPILVPRTAEQKAKLPSVVQQLKLKATSTSPTYPPILIFPEGTTVSQDYLIQFQQGAFLPGLPVQPIAIRYPFFSTDVSWTPDIDALPLFFRILCQVYNRMEVTYLPPYYPSPAEVADPQLFASNVRGVIAQSLGNAVTDFSDHDAAMFAQAHAEGDGEYAMMHLLSDVTTRISERKTQRHLRDLLHLSKLFRKADRDQTGTLTLEEFTSALELADDIQSERRAECLFNFFDHYGTGEIQYQDVILGLSATVDERPREEMIDFAFNVYDRDGDGFVKASDISWVLSRLRRKSYVSSTAFDQELAAIDSDAQPGEPEWDGEGGVEEAKSPGPDEQVSNGEPGVSGGSPGAFESQPAASSGHSWTPSTPRGARTPRTPSTPKSPSRLLNREEFTALAKEHYTLVVRGAVEMAHQTLGLSAPAPTAASPGHLPASLAPLATAGPNFHTSRGSGGPRDESPLLAGQNARPSPPTLRDSGPRALSTVYEDGPSSLSAPPPK